MKIVWWKEWDIKENDDDVAGEEDEEGEVKLSLADEELLADLTYDELKQAFRFIMIIVIEANLRIKIWILLLIIIGHVCHFLPHLAHCIAHQKPFHFFILMKMKKPIFMKLIASSYWHMAGRWDQPLKKFLSEVTSCLEKANYQRSDDFNWFPLMVNAFIYQIYKEFLEDFFIGLIFFSSRLFDADGEGFIRVATFRVRA